MYCLSLFTYLMVHAADPLAQLREAALPAFDVNFCNESPLTSANLNQSRVKRLANTVKLLLIFEVTSALNFA